MNHLRANNSGVAGLYQNTTQMNEVIMNEKTIDNHFANADNTPEKKVRVLGKETDMYAASVILETVKHTVAEVVKQKVMTGANREEAISAAEITAEAIVKGMTFMIRGPK
ncbi:hypothetical protein ACNFJN_08290 [Xenorhabdus budapestensis]|uniref:hypothetical protein n=1 Tax=Xenorhabdus budapestensis TaxID=290110 RepID=UPI003A898F08